MTPARSKAFENMVLGLYDARACRAQATLAIAPVYHIPTEDGAFGRSRHPLVDQDGSARRRCAEAVRVANPSVAYGKIAATGPECETAACYSQRLAGRCKKGDA